MNTKPSTAEQAAVNATKPAQSPKPQKSAKTLAFDKALAQTDREARRKAAAILEVLAGARKPSDAAQALGVSSMRYYLLETRAILGLVKACEPPKLGPKGSPDREAQVLRKQVARLERECARYAALARVAQRAVNLAPPPVPGKSATGKKGRRTKPPVRAVRMLARVQSGLHEGAPGEAQAASAPAVGATP